jgi:outer membrane protein, multidrug efflux system
MLVKDARHAGHCRERHALVATALIVLPILLILLASGGCTVGPTYRVPEVPTPPSFGELPASTREAPLSLPSSSEGDLGQWWLQFHDPELDRLVERALRGNLDLQSAASRIRQGREAEIVAGAPLWPSFGSSASALHLHANSNPLAGLAGSSGSSAGSGSSTGGSSSGNSSLGLTMYSLGFDATWELDLFGQTRHAVQAARAATEASLWQMRDAQVSLTAEVANDYIQLRATQARIEIARDSIRSQETLLALARSRARVGLVTELDVDQQLAQLASTRAELPALTAEGKALMHALAVLLAEQPLALMRELGQGTAVPTVPTSLPAGLPSDLLRRRPDVREAERRLAAATAEEGVAVAALYPKFDLLGLAAFAGGSVSGLVSSDHLSTLGLGLIDWPIFQGGQREATIGVDREARTQSYLAYRQSVLVALQDAEDALVRYAGEQQHLLALRQGQAAAASSLLIAQAQYRTGLVTFINVLQASAADLNARDEVEQSIQALAQDLVSLYKALGGGWDHPPGESRNDRSITHSAKVTGSQ